MAEESSKDLFESDMFSARIFAAGVFRSASWTSQGVWCLAAQSTYNPGSTREQCYRSGAIAEEVCGR